MCGYELERVGSGSTQQEASAGRECKLAQGGDTGGGEKLKRIRPVTQAIGKPIFCKSNYKVRGMRKAAHPLRILPSDLLAHIIIGVGNQVSKLKAKKGKGQ